MATLRQQIATNVLTVTKFRDLMKLMRDNRPTDDLEIIRKAYEFSQRHHAGQTRASGKPYLVHPVEVALVLAEMKMDPVQVAAGSSARLGRRYLRDYRGYPQGNLWRAGRAHRGRRHQNQQNRFCHSRRAVQAENLRKMMLLAMVDDIFASC